ncbi:MAG: glycosyltransferase family 4 protein [Holosporaceae bacterium]|jgi:glycosyltransferase involved in cell wall biosynthesis|nr:glycosyltransferase family 4 protein [Holosporaceae bacterium]
MSRILYTSPELIHPAVGGPYLRVENSVKALSKISELHVISRMKLSHADMRETENFYKKITPFFGYLPQTPPKSLSRFLKKLSYKKAEISADWEADYVVDYMIKNDINIIWCGYGNVSHSFMKRIKKKSPQFRIVCDTDSVWSRFVLRGLPFAEDDNKRRQIIAEYLRKEKEEIDWVDFCDVTTAVSEIDADYYRSIAVNPGKVKTFSNVIDLEYYSQKQSPPEFFKTPSIYLCGSFWPGGSPMETAARWVVDEIFPTLKREIPDIHFYIVGRDSDKVLEDINDENITVTGRLDNVLPYLCNASVCIVPLKFESGTRFKILEAAACGIPIVSTTLGAEGIPVKNEENIMIADDADAFARAIIKLIRFPDRAKNMAHALKQYVEENYNISKHVREGGEILKFLEEKQRIMLKKVLI